ncbi:MAG: hypothetical protein HYY93_01720 [Planctomycetes bacterium]|nr:hypothetical protein [Planctomycetota bacterium]
MTRIEPSAPERFVRWMSAHRHVDRETGQVYRYHPRSDSHAIALCSEILSDLLSSCPTLARQAKDGRIVFGINVLVESAETGKKKTLDLAIGLPPAGEKIRSGDTPIAPGTIDRILFSCEAKTVMTEHSKSKPRLYDELSSSHEIVHQSWPDAIATGITIVNIANSFVSPLRQTAGKPVCISEHKQPRAAAGMIAHLRGLRQRDEVGKVGFDAFASVVVECDNQSDKVSLWTSPPAPQAGDVDSYQAFLTRVGHFWDRRFLTLPPAAH